MSRVKGLSSSSGQRPQAEEALRRLQGFDGRLAAGSGDAALYEAFLQALAEQTFVLICKGSKIYPHIGLT